MTSPQRQRLEELYQDTKNWQKAYSRAHNGAKPSGDAIKADPEISAMYSAYWKLRSEMNSSASARQPPDETTRSSKRRRDEEDCSGRDRKIPRGEGPENDSPPSASEIARRKKRDDFGRFRKGTVPAEGSSSRPHMNAPSTPSRHARRSKQHHPSIYSRLAADQPTPAPVDDEAEDPTYTPEGKKTHVSPTPQKWRFLGLEHAINLEEEMIINSPSSRGKSGNMVLRDRELIDAQMITAVGVADEDMVPKERGKAGVRVIVPTPAHSQEDAAQIDNIEHTTSISAAACTPSKGKGKGRAVSPLPEATPSNPLRHGRTPPSSGRRFALQHAITAPGFPFATSATSATKRKCDVVDLTGDDTVTHGPGSLTPNSKPTSSSPHKDITDTPAFLRTRPAFRYPLGWCELKESHDPEEDDLQPFTESPEATPSKRSKSLSSCPPLRPNFTSSTIKSKGKLKNMGKSLRELLLAVVDRLDEEMDEEQAIMDEAMSVPPADEDDEQQGSTSNPFNRKKAPKRQTKKGNLKPKPAVSHFVEPQKPAKKLAKANEVDEGNAIPDEKVRGEPERKRFRSAAPTVDSMAFAANSVEWPPARDTPDVKDEEGDELVMINKSFHNNTEEVRRNGNSKQPSSNLTNRIDADGFERFKNKAKHHLSGNFQRLKHLSRGQGKKNGHGMRR